MDKSLPPDHSDQIAIIGMAGRFPGARTVAEFWQNLRDGVESITIFSPEQIEATGVDAALINHPNYVNARGILEDIALFDASFFAYNPREAELMDPQHRFFLECAWEALEIAGYDPETYDGRIGVYAGESMNTYFLSNLQSNRELLESVGAYQTFLGNDRDFLSTLISYKLNLKGPSCTVQTACSTSLIAIHLACQSLLNGESDLAIAGGVSISVPQKAGYLYVEGGIKSPDGHCRAFDRRAQGTVSGQGVGVVILKPLAEALTDGDHIEAVIKGSAMNNDGASKIGYTAPSVDGQAKVITEALAMAGVEAQSIGYIETHGTGTPLGDPIEITALTQAFRTETDKNAFCAIGSVKTNIGHLDAAAGVASIVKTVMALKHKVLPPSLHFEEPNPEIDFEHSPFYVNDKLSEWKSTDTPRRAGVSSFGIGGTNGHVILEEAPVVEPSGPSRHRQLLVLSAKSAAALDSATVRLIDYLKQHPAIEMADVAYTLHTGRRCFDHRRILVCGDLEDAVIALSAQDPQRVFTAAHELGKPSITFMFPGQGAQHVNMALELYQTEPMFRAEIDRCSVFLEPHLGFDLRRLLYPNTEQTDEAAQRLTQTLVTQPALFAVEYALAKLMMAWGVCPQAMIGHSIGEYVAACLAGVFSLEEGLALVSARGRLMQKLPGGGMLAVSLPEQKLYPFLSDELSLAAHNAPSLCVVSGPTDAITTFHQRMTEHGIACRRLQTSHAFHTETVMPILGSFIEEVKKVNLKPPKIPFVSNVTGSWITDAEATDPFYWARHLRQTVRFAAGIQTLLREPDLVLLEVGPGHSLSTLARQQLKAETAQLVLTTLRASGDEQSDVEVLLNSLGRLWLAGIEPDWAEFYRNEHRHRVPLPTYPFERQSYWVEAQTNRPDRYRGLFKKPDVSDWFYIPSWQRTALPQILPTSEEHQQISWLVFLDDLGFGAELAVRLEQEEYHVIKVEMGSMFGLVQPGHYTINPSHEGDYFALLDELRTLGQYPDRIVHFWSLVSHAHSQSGAEFFQHCQKTGFYSLLFLTHALAKTNSGSSIRVEIVSNNLHNVTGEESLLPEQSTILGLCKIVPQEYPYIICRNIDVAIPSTDASPDKNLIEQLGDELATKASAAIVAYRGGHRWIPRYEKFRLDGPTFSNVGLRKGGVYFITGGLGQIGLVLAAHLAGNAKAKLVLLGRSILPARENWAQWLHTHDDHDHVSSKIRSVLALEELGGEAMVINADVANLLQMQDAIGRTIERFGDLHGVIHAAGIPTHALHSIQDISRTECEQHFQSKVYGLFVLEKVLSTRELDFCLLLSSLSAVLGGVGFLTYAAANAFMDTFADRHNQTNPTAWTSVNLDGWDPGHQASMVSPVTAAGTELAISSTDGTEVFKRILSVRPVSQIVVSTTDLQTRIDASLKRESPQDSVRTTKQDSGWPGRHVRPNLPNAIVTPRNQTEQLVAEVWQELLGIEQVGVHDNFFELGGHSLLGIQLVSRLRDLFSVEISPHRLFETPTVSGLAECIAQADQVERNDLDQIIPMLEFVEQLSEDEVKMGLSEMHVSREDGSSNA
ncbi:MAG TPA: SDR family NAD(P)-dependent oxidoreductase [Pyrinomonadaceae bacterium]